MSPQRKKVLTEFVSTQLFQMPGETPYFNDECMAVGYGAQTLYDVGLTKAEMKKEIITLRNEGIVELTPCVNEDGEPHGSGYFLTAHGLEYVKQHFTNEEFESLI